ncbi:MAG: DUF2461 domain-containing protein [bacterium]
MRYFTPGFLEFFEELAKNNDKPWFEANKKRYIASVKEPFEAFIGEMIARVSADDPAVAITPKDAIFRIYRDVRFSKDKTPYKTHVGAVISAGGRKDMSNPGRYLQLDAEFVRIYGGLHMPDSKQLYALRQTITNKLDEFNALLNDKDFKEKFGMISGEQHKRVPKEFEAAATKQPLIKNKQFYYFAKLDPKTVLDPKLPEIVMVHYFAGKKMNTFLRKAIGK